jgi:thiamine biosynthesis lipoprotein
MNKCYSIMVSLALLDFAHIAAAEPVRFEYSEPHMGTTFRFICYAEDKATADRAAKAGFARVAKLNGIMSDYLDSSELMQLCKKNEEKPAGPVKVSDDLFFVLSRAEEASKLSDGAFDVTVRPFVVLWRLARRTQRLPDPKELAEARMLVGYRKLKLDSKAKTVAFEVAGMQLDLGGIAKGYAADEVLKVLANFGIINALCAAGGDIAVSGAPPGTEGWKVDIAPLPGSKDKRTLLLKDAAVSTSGDAEQFAVIDGVRYSHIVDPRTGIGLTGRRSVTVIARRGITSDSMTKVASILPAEKALGILERTQGVLAVLIIRKTESAEETFESKRFVEYLWNPRPK